MKTLKIFLVMFLSVVFLGGTMVQAQDNKNKEPEKKGWSKKAKGATIGGVGGVTIGALLGGTKGAIVGGAAGTVAGGAVGKKKDKKTDNKRYEQYTRKDNN